MSESGHKFKHHHGEVYTDGDGQRRRTVTITRDKEAEAAAALPLPATDVPASREPAPEAHDVESGRRHRR